MGKRESKVTSNERKCVEGGLETRFETKKHRKMRIPEITEGGFELSTRVVCLQEVRRRFEVRSEGGTEGAPFSTEVDAETNTKIS